MTLKTELAKTLVSVIPQVSEEEAAFLDRISDVSQQKDYFVCLIYRMPLSDLQELYKRKAESQAILNARNEYLVEIATKRDEMIQKAAGSLERLENVLKTDEALKEQLAMIVKETGEAHEREREALKDQIVFLKEEQKEYKDRIKKYEGELQTLKDKNRQMVLDGQKHEHFSGNKTRMCSGGILKKHLSRRQTEKLQEETEAFFDELGKTEGLTDAQKDYLIGCLERYPVRIISKVMKANLSVEQMDKFIVIYRKKLGGNAI